MPFVRNVREEFGIMVEGYSNAHSVIAFYVKMINLSIKHLAKYWKQKISNVITAIKNIAFFILNLILILHIYINQLYVHI